MAVNQFLKIRRCVEKMVGNYKETFDSIKYPFELHSKTIYRIAHPYLHGCFTLAVIGDMSSGKSTFINTLIGVNILPTGHFQTTSAITYIEHRAKPSIKVKFADGHEETFSGKEIKTILYNLVALPEEYNDLPINDINLLISGGDTLGDILAKKDGIEEKTHLKCDVALWERYVEAHPQSKIASEVHVYYPLPEEMHGWKIVDTPGVGAIGGIQEATKRLFSSRDKDGNKLVDAIIFLKRGDSNIESEADMTFLENVFNQLTNEAKERLFFILTHATAQKFRLYRDDILEKTRHLFGSKYHIPQSRLTHVDSLLARFHDDILAQGLSAKDIDPDIADPLDGWSKDECNAMFEMYSPLKRELKNRSLAINNENLLSLMEEWGNFSSLKKIINDFVREVKEVSFQKIASQIREDYELMIETYEKEIEELSGGQKVIDVERKRLKQKKVEYHKVLNKLRQLSAITPLLEKFKFVDNELASLSQKKTIDEVRVAYQNLMEKATSIEHKTFDELESEFQSYCKRFDPKDIILRQIDFKTLEVKAQESSTTEIPVYETETYETGGWSSETKTRAVYVRTDKKVDQQKKLREFVAYVLNESRPIVSSFREQLKEKVKLLCKLVEEDINQKMLAKENRLNELEEKLKDKKLEEEDIRGRLNIVAQHLEVHNCINNDNNEK